MVNCYFYAQNTVVLYRKSDKMTEKTEKLKDFLTFCSVV